jgi:uncharacterized surface protein with fasciclin (FAS1) repeats
LDIVEQAIATSDLSILVQAPEVAGLVDDLQADGLFTEFAPTNEAFEAFLVANNFASLSDIPVDVLTQVLLNQLVSGTNLSTSPSTGYVSSLSTAGAGGNNLSLFIDTTSGVVVNGISEVVTADVEASNGVIHVLNKVMIPDTNN